MNRPNALRHAVRHRFLREPHLINALITGANVWPPDDDTNEELLALAQDRIREAEGDDGGFAVSSIRFDELCAARDALSVLCVCAN